LGTLISTAARAVIKGDLLGWGKIGAMNVPLNPIQTHANQKKGSQKAP